jgi:hypothetical protein
VVLDGLVGLAEVAVGNAEIAEGVTLAVPVADLAGDGEALIVKVDGLPGLAEGGPGEAEIAEGVALALPVADLAGDGEVLPV